MYQTASYTEPNVSVSMVVDRFATEPITSVQVANEQLSEEELHTLFEQAINGRLLAIDARLSRINGSLTTLSGMAGHRACATSVESFPSTRPLNRREGSWWSLMSNSWRRTITQVSLALMLLMSGFDLMGLLVLHVR